MKKTILLYFVSSCFFCCENHTEIENSLQGKWNVTQIIGGFSPAKNYNEEEFTWLFDLDTSTVTIQNNKDVFNGLDIPRFINNQGGIYSFDIIIENDIEHLVVGERKGTIQLINNELTIYFGIAYDDIAYIFKR